jgi:hypothetical protein
LVAARNLVNTLRRRLFASFVHKSGAPSYRMGSCYVVIDLGFVHPQTKLMSWA